MSKRGGASCACCPLARTRTKRSVQPELRCAHFLGRRPEPNGTSASRCTPSDDAELTHAPRCLSLRKAPPEQLATLRTPSLLPPLLAGLLGADGRDGRARSHRRRRSRRLPLLLAPAVDGKAQVGRAPQPHRPARPELVHPPNRVSPVADLLTAHRALRCVPGSRRSQRRSSTPCDLAEAVRGAAAATRAALATRRADRALWQAAWRLGTVAGGCGRRLRLALPPLAAESPSRARTRPLGRGLRVGRAAQLPRCNMLEAALLAPAPRPRARRCVTDWRLLCTRLVCTPVCGPLLLLGVGQSGRVYNGVDTQVAFECGNEG